MRGDYIGKFNTKAYWQFGGYKKELGKKS